MRRERDPESKAEMVWACWGKEENDWVKKYTRMNVTGVVDRGALRKMWSCVKRDMEAMGIKEKAAQDRYAWRNISRGPTRASADA